MPEITTQALRDYLSSVLAAPVEILRVSPLGEVAEGGSVKTYGYGEPLRIDYRVAGSEPRAAVFHTSRPNSFGHEHMADRAQGLLWSHASFGRLPRHTDSLDVGGVRADGSIAALGGVEEFCLLTEYVEGQGYNRDLDRLLESGELTGLDRERAEALCDYLAAIHGKRSNEAGLYRRRIRELVGHGECVMGLIDSYPPHPAAPAALLARIEHLCVDWRWRLRSLTHRLCQVHGDFHPWNILFERGAEFHVLDRSRGEWGEAADDVTSLTANYLFFSLRRSGRLEGCFEELFTGFWDRYLAATGDREMLRVAAPFFAFRCLVMASPVWYPSLGDEVRGKLLRFAVNVLEADAFDPHGANAYCEAAPVAGRTESAVPAGSRAVAKEHTPAFAVWLTGLPSSGKSTIAAALKRQLADLGVEAALLESDALRPVFTPQAHYAAADRDDFYRLLAFVGTLLVNHGVPVIFDATANLRRYRDGARAEIPRFIEVFVDCQLEVCMERDPKGIYQKAREGSADNVPGVQAEYQPPLHPELTARGDRDDPEEAASRIVELVRKRGFLRQ